MSFKQPSTLDKRHLGASASIRTRALRCKKSDTLEVATSSVLFRARDTQSTPNAGEGRLWVRNNTPTALIFTDDAGADTELGSPQIAIQADGVPVASTSILNFASGLSASETAPGTVEVVSSGVVDVQDDGVSIATGSSLNFTGGGVTVTDAGGGEVTVNIPVGNYLNEANNTISIGTNTSAATDSIAIGSNTTIAPSSPSSVVVGGGCSVSANAAGSVVIGRYASCSGSGGIAIGYGSTAQDDSAIIISGNQGYANARAIGIGQDARAIQPDSISIGFESRAYTDRSIALGAGCAVTNSNTFGIRVKSTAGNSFETDFSTLNSTSPSAGSLAIPAAVGFLRVAVEGVTYDIPLLNADST